MKKILVSLMVFFGLFMGIRCICSNLNAKSEKEFNTRILYDRMNSTTIEKVTIEGHDYYYAVFSGYHCGGVSIIHSENCKCKKQ